MTIKANDIIVPLDVPKAARENYIQNYLSITRESGRLMLYAGDQKVEHLNNDFYGEGIHTDDNEPEHLFLKTSQVIIPYVLALSAASFIYIAIADLIPSLHKKVGPVASIRQFILILAGVGTILFFRMHH